MKITTWNVNGIRAARGKGFLDWLSESGSDVVFLQETKIQENQLPEDLIEPGDYQSAWFSAVKKGYSSVGVYFREKPDKIEKGMGIPEYDVEGRSISVFYDKLVFIGAYFPNSQDLGARLHYKIGFNDAILSYCDKLRGQGYEIVLTGDYNVAHRPVDLARPSENEKNAGYLPEERQWMDKFLSAGYVDSFRYMHGDIPAQYSWWTFRANARARNVGWRIDYTNVSEDLSGRIKACDIHPNVMGSDHCPVNLVLAD